MIGIKDMEMPKRCAECRLFHFYLDTNGLIHYICKYGNVEVLMADEKRASDCPLTEIVACKDCKYWKGTTCLIHNGFQPPEDWHCADGERRNTNGQ